MSRWDQSTIERQPTDALRWRRRHLYRTRSAWYFDGRTSATIEMHGMAAIDDELTAISHEMRRRGA